MDSNSKTIFVGVLSFLVGIVVGTLIDNPVVSLTGQDRSAGTSEVSTQGSVTGSSNVSGQTESASSGGGFTIDVSSLPAAQQAALKTAGITDSQIYISAEMIACAETAVGSARVEEIKNGAAPSISEGVKLVGCL